MVQRETEAVERYLGAANLEFDDFVGLFDLDRTSVFSTRFLQEITDVGDLFWLQWIEGWERCE